MPLERLRRQELSPVALEARSIERTAADSLYSIVNHRPGRLLSPVHRTGWAGLGWARLGWLGLQSAVCSVPEDSVPFGRAPRAVGPQPITL